MIFAHVKPNKLLELSYTPDKRIHNGIIWELLSSNREPDGEGSTWLSYNFHFRKIDGTDMKTQSVFSYEKMDGDGVNSCAKQLIDYLFFDDDEY